MTVKSSPLRLKNLIITKEKIEANPQECGEGKNTPSVDFSIQFGRVEFKDDTESGEADAIFFSLSVNRRRKKAPFRVEIEGFALFECDLKEESQRLKLLVYNGTVMVFGFLRGYVYAKLGILSPECRLIPSADIREVIEKAVKENSSGSE